MTAGTWSLDGLAADLVASADARQALVSDPGGWCRERSLGPVEIEGLMGRIRRLADGDDPVERRVVLATCFALGSLVRT